MSNVSNKRVNIYIDQTAAENALQNLQKKADGVNKKIEACRESQNKLLAAITKNEAAGAPVDKLRNQYQELQIKINSFNKDQRENKTAMNNVQQQIDKGMRPSMAQLERQVSSLKNQLRNMSQDAKGYANTFKQFQAASAQLDGLKNSINGVGKAQHTWFDEVKMHAFSVALGLTVHKLAESVGEYFSVIDHSSAELSDSLSQLKIYLHGTDEDAQNLYKSLKQIDTRTGTRDLLDIATIVAKKGVAKEEIVGVTQALDQLFVVLGKEVGDPHEAVASLVKLVNIYSEDHHVTAKNIGDIGAAIQKLTSSGVATGDFLINFAERLAGVRGVTGITIQSVLGLGAALQELGQKNESAATAAQKLITAMFLKPAVYAKATGLEITKFSEMLAKDPVEALIKVAGTLKETAAAPEDLLQEFQSMEITGARVFGVLGDIAGNAEYMRKRLKDAQQAFGDQASITEAFKEKNTNLAASIAKLGKAFNSVTSSTTLLSFLSAVINTLAALVNAFKAVGVWMKENQTGIYLIVTGIAIMNASYIKAGALIIRDTALKIKNAVVTKGTAIATNIAIAAQAAWITITELLTGRITLAIAAQRLWNITMSLGAGPIGAILLVVGALTVGIISLYNATHKLTAAQQLQKDIQQKVVENTSDQVSKIEILKQVINDNTVSLDNRKKALQALIDINPKYLQGLTLENFHTEEGKKKLDEYITSLKTKAEVEAKASLLTDKLKQRDSAIISLKAEADFSGFSTEDFEKYAAGAAKSAEKSSLFGLFKTAKLGDVDLLALNDAFQQIKILQTDIGEAAKKDVETVITTTTTTAQAAADTIGDIKKQISQLDDDLDKIDKKNTNAIKENRDKRQKLQEELDKLIGDNKISKKAEKDANKASEEWDKLIEKINENMAKLTQDPY